MGNPDTFIDYWIKWISMKPSSFYLSNIDLYTLLGIDYVNTTYSERLDNALFPYPSSLVVPLVNYANFNEKCVDVCLTLFLQYSPYILLIQVDTGIRAWYLRYRIETQYWKPGFMCGVRQFCRYRYFFCEEILFCMAFFYFLFVF